MKISVIIPVYNLEKYIKKCLESVVNQTYRQLEIIIIDDGSTDDSIKIIEEYLKDKRVKFIKQNKEGVYAARNKAIALATGDYISFVDGDDWLELSAYEKLVKNIEGEDLIIFDFDKYDDLKNRILEKRKSLKELKNILNEDNQYLIMTYNNEAWNKIYKTSYLKNNNFLFPEILYEDVVWRIETFLLASKIKILDETFYYYRVNRQGSIMQNTKKVINDKEFLNQRERAYQENYRLISEFIEKFRDKLNSQKLILGLIDREIWHARAKQEVDIREIIGVIKENYFNDKSYKIIFNELKILLEERRVKKYIGISIFDKFLWKNKIISFQVLKRKGFSYFL